MGEAPPPRWPPPPASAHQQHPMYIRNVNTNMHGYPGGQYYPPQNSGNGRRRGGGRGGGRREQPQPPPCLMPYPHYYPQPQGPPLYHVPVYQPMYCPYAAPYYQPEYYDENTQEAAPSEEYYQAGPYAEPDYYYPPPPAPVPGPPHTFNVHAKNFVQHVHSYPAPEPDTETLEMEMRRMTLAPAPPQYAPALEDPPQAPSVVTPVSTPVPEPAPISAVPVVSALPNSIPSVPVPISATAVSPSSEPERIFVKQQPPVNATAPPFSGKVVVNSSNATGKGVPPFSTNKFNKGAHPNPPTANVVKTPAPVSEPAQRSPSPVRAPPPTAADFPPPPAPRNAPTTPQATAAAPAPQPAPGKSWASLFAQPKSAPLVSISASVVAAPAIKAASVTTAAAAPTSTLTALPPARVPSNVAKPVAKVLPFDASPSPAPPPFNNESPKCASNGEKSPTTTTAMHAEIKTTSPTAKTPFNDKASLVSENTSNDKASSAYEQGTEKVAEKIQSYSEKTAISYSEKTSVHFASYSAKTSITGSNAAVKVPAPLSYSEKTSSAPSYSEKTAVSNLSTYSEKSSAADIQVRPSEVSSGELDNKVVAREESVGPKSATQSDDPASFRIGEMLRVYKLEYRGVVPAPRGLCNRSNLCYANAVLQALVSLPPFYNLMRALPGRTKTNPSLLDAMVDLCGQWTPAAPLPPPPTHQRGARNRTAPPAPTPLDAVASLNVLQALRPQTAQHGHEHKQEDAEEFFTALLNELNDEMMQLMRLAGEEAVPVAKEEEPPAGQVELSDDDEWKVQASRRRCVVPLASGSPSLAPASPLTGLLRGAVRARTHRAHHATDSLQPFFTLPIDIQRAHSVIEALEQLSGSPTGGGGGGSEGEEPWQQTWLEQLPPVLCLHLKCFRLLRGHTAKIIQPIDYPLELPLHSKMLSPSARGVYTGKQRHYRLQAVVYHEGADAAKGHYLTDALHPHQGWIRYDDSSVSNVSEAAVLKPRAPRMPYILLYRRLDTLPPKGNKDA